MERIKRIANFITASLFEKIFTAWFMASAVLIVSNGGEISLECTNVSAYITVFIAVFIFICCFEYRFAGTSGFLLVVSLLLFSFIVLMNSKSIFTFIALAIFYCLSVHHFLSKKELNVNILKKNTIIVVVFCVIWFFLTVTLLSVLRYTTYSTPNYDFGIFSNMYYNMSKSFQPLVSCERDQILSHFAVHFSPALYVFLPIYFIFPSSITIAVCQTVAVYSAVFPFILIMKHKNMPNLNICLLTVVFMASATLAGGCMFDFHENCLLVPFLMWMFYFYEKQKTSLTLLFAMLTLMVKEDAFIYIVVFAGYIIVAKKDFLKGSVMAVCAVVYFFAVCSYLKNQGTGIMSYRYDSMITGNDGLFGIIKTVFANPDYTIKNLFNEKNETADKLIYFIELLAPLAFIPFFTKKSSRLILILPICLNLLTDYTYQYNITFQYSFGISTFLLYSSILNVHDMEKKNRNFSSVIAAGLSVMMFFMVFVPKLSDYINRQLDSSEMYAEMTEVLEIIDSDASVTASTFLIPHICNRTEIYESFYRTECNTDYLVLDMRSEYQAESFETAEKWIKNGYQLTEMGNEFVYIYEKCSG